MANQIPFNPFMTAQIIQSQQISQQYQQMAMNQQQHFSFPWMNNFGQNQQQSAYEKKIVPKVNNQTAKILLDWFNEHVDHPYSEAEDRQMLREKTGFTDTQIGDWFRNRRRNVKKGGNAKWEVPVPTSRKRRSSSFFGQNDSNFSSNSISTSSTTPTPSTTISTPALSDLLNTQSITVEVTVKADASSNNSALSSSPSNDQNATSNTDTSTDDSDDFVDVVTVASGLKTSNDVNENSPPSEKRIKL